MIGKDGAVKDARVVASAPTAERLQGARGAEGDAGGARGRRAPRRRPRSTPSKQWRYEPILKDGKPVEVKATVTVNFKLS